MSGVRDYSPGTRAALQTLSRGSCYWPGCGEPVVRLLDFCNLLRAGRGDRGRGGWGVIVT